MTKLISIIYLILITYLSQMYKSEIIYIESNLPTSDFKFDEITYPF